MVWNKSSNELREDVSFSMETDFAGKNSGSLPLHTAFFTRAITLNLPQSVRNAYFLGDAAYSDFEQLCREWFLLAIAAAAVGWFCYEQITLRPKRKLPLTRIMTVVFLFWGSICSWDCCPL